MPGTPVALHPFSGGMNNRSGIETVQNDELPLVVNMEFDIDGSVVSRPAITVEGNQQGGSTYAAQILGYYTRDDGQIFLVQAYDTTTWIYQLSTKSWTKIADFRAADFVQYDNKIVMISTTVAGGRWENGTYTAMPTMPLGARIVVYKERFWAYGPPGTQFSTTVYFSNLTVISPPTTIYTWTPATDFFTVNLGDGEQITNMVADTNALLIFKSRSTYGFDYPSAPRNGTLRKLSATIGAENRWSVVSYENYYLVYSQGYLYQFIQQRYYPLNAKKIDFERSPDVTVTAGIEIRLSIFGPRAMLWFFGHLYVYNIITATWTTWESPTTRAAHFLTVPSSPSSATGLTALAICGSNEPAKRKLYRIEEDVLQSGTGEAFTWMIRTKAYSFDEPGKYKRLLYVTVGLKTATGATIIAHPLALGVEVVTWDQMATKTWDELALGTFDNPLIIPTQWEADVDFPTAAPVQVLIRARAAYRFLMTYFEISGDVDGTIRTAPARLYSLTPYLMIHADVSREVS